MVLMFVILQEQVWVVLRVQVQEGQQVQVIPQQERDQTVRAHDVQQDENVGLAQVELLVSVELEL